MKNLWVNKWAAGWKKKRQIVWKKHQAVGVHHPSEATMEKTYLDFHQTLILLPEISHEWNYQKL